MKLISACSLLLLPAAHLGAAIGLASTQIRDLRKSLGGHRNVLTRRDIDPTLLYPAYNFSVPVDHFHNESQYEPHSNDKFNLRYYFDASHYKAGGPIIVLEGGETGADDRLAYLQKGILAQLAQVTHGIGVVIEHRYYGTSFPTPDLSTENLRFLTTQQAMADVAYFAQNIKFPGLEHLDLTAPKNPYILYGGSYAGAFVAFMRVIYPDLFWGAISSSGVTEAIWDYWEYYEPVRQYGPPDCVATTQKLTNVVDNIILKHNDPKTIATLKAAFSLSNMTYIDDFANQLAQGVGWWQSKNWDPAVNYPDFDLYCTNITSNKVLYPTTEPLRSTAQHLIQIGGWGSEESLLTNRLLNYMGWVNLTRTQPCLDSNSTLDECYSQRLLSFYEQDDLSQWVWRSWNYQYCTQFGYLQTGSGVPKNQLPLISRTISLEYLMVSCNLAFNITGPPDLESINKYGGYDICYPRLAIIGGEWDPWRPATPLADVAPKRKSTIDEPFELIAKAVHHWDENGLFPNETTPSLPPPPVAAAQKSERQFVQEWMQEWKSHKH